MTYSGPPQPPPPPGQPNEQPDERPGEQPYEPGAGYPQAPPPSVPQYPPNPEYPQPPQYVHQPPPPPGYGQAPPTQPYGEQPGYGQPVYPAPGYGQPAPAYGQPAPAYGQPAYGGYPSAYPAFGPAGEPPRRKRKKWPWIVGSIVVILIVLGVIGVVFGRTGSGDPHTAVDRFWSALVQHDRSKAEKYVCSSKNLTSNEGFTTLVNGLTGYDIGAEQGSGNTRKYPVTAHLSVSGQTGDLTILTTVKRNSGKWYVCDLENS